MFEIYRRAFLDSNIAHWWGEEIIYRSWDQNTMYLYFGLVLFAMIIGWQIDKAKVKYSLVSLSHDNVDFSQYSPIRKRLFSFFVIIAFVLGCRDYTVGMDTVVYRNSVDHAVSLSQIFADSTTEPIYKVIVYLLHQVVGSGTIAIFIYAVATIFFVYKGLKRYVGNISVYVCLMAYICIYFFPAMNLVRLHLAASIVFTSMPLFLDEKYKKFYLILITTCLIHYSTAVMFIPLGMYHVYTKNKALALTGVAVLAMIIVVSVSILGDYIAMLDRYTSYISGNTSGSGIGIMLFIDYLPALYLLYYISHYGIKGKLADMTVCFTCAALVVRLLAYNISAAGRLHAHFMFLTIILIPYWAWYMKNNNSSNYKLFLILCTIWALFRLHIYFVGYLATDGIMPYMLAF